MDRRSAHSTEETKRLLDSAGLRLVLEHGVENVGIRDICREAGVSIGTFYNYYANKSEFMLNRLGYMDQHLLKISKELCGDAAEKLKQVFFAYLVQGSFRGAGFSLSVFHAMTDITTDRETTQNRFFFLLVRDILCEGKKTGLFNPALAAEETALGLIAMVRGISMDWARHDGCYALQPFAQGCIEVLLKGISI